MSHTIYWEIPEDSDVEAGEKFPVEFSDSEWRRVQSAMGTLDLAPEAFMAKGDSWAGENHPEIQERVNKEYLAKGREPDTDVEAVKIEAFGELVKRRVVKFAEFVNTSNPGRGNRVNLVGGLQ